MLVIMQVGEWDPLAVWWGEQSPEPDRHHSGTNIQGRSSLVCFHRKTLAVSHVEMGCDRCPTTVESSILSLAAVMVGFSITNLLIALKPVLVMVLGLPELGFLLGVVFSGRSRAAKSSLWNDQCKRPSLCAISFEDIFIDAQAGVLDFSSIEKFFAPMVVKLIGRLQLLNSAWIVVCCDTKLWLPEYYYALIRNRYSSSVVEASSFSVFVLVKIIELCIPFCVISHTGDNFSCNDCIISLSGACCEFLICLKISV